MNFSKVNIIIRKINPYVLIVVITILGASGIRQEWSLKHSQAAAATAEDETLIQNIESYLDKIGLSFSADSHLLASENNIPSWGCGPSSYALASIIDRKFFENKILINASYDNNPYEIVERFGFSEFEQNGQKIIGDHAWLEVYIHDQMLFIDPTIAQYGKVKGTVYRLFKVGDPNIKQILKNDYSIIDNRISKLVQKSLDKIPIDQEPYPGFAVDPAFMGYYLNIVELRNTVNIGHEPKEWQPWVSALVDKYR